MKKLYFICLIIIILGTIINLGIYFNGLKLKQQENNKPQEAVQDNKEKLKRPIAFMINNIPEAWPQSGIYAADYVYEMLVEGGITRLMAVYTTKSDIEKIGPIRSARHNFLDITMEYNAIYAHFGGSPKAFEDIGKLKIPSLNGIPLDGKMYWRDSTRKAPHNAYTSISKTLEYAQKFGFDKEIGMDKFLFNNNQTVLTGNDAISIKIPYSISHITSYQYDNATGLYNRFMRNVPHVDGLINKQLTAKNIIIQFAKNNTMDDENRQEIYLVGNGKGYYITDGKYISINWKKSARNEKTFYYDQFGKEILLNKGQTWIQIVPLDAKVEIE